MLGWTELRDERIELRPIARGVCLRGWLIHQLAWRNPEFLIDRYVFCFVFLYRTNNRGQVVHGTQMTRIAAKWEPVVYRDLSFEQDADKFWSRSDQRVCVLKRMGFGCPKATEGEVKL